MLANIIKDYENEKEILKSILLVCFLFLITSTIHLVSMLVVVSIAVIIVSFKIMSSIQPNIIKVKTLLLYPVIVLPILLFSFLWVYILPFYNPIAFNISLPIFLAVILPSFGQVFFTLKNAPIKERKKPFILVYALSIAITLFLIIGLNYEKIFT